MPARHPGAKVIALMLLAGGLTWAPSPSGVAAYVPLVLVAMAMAPGSFAHLLQLLRRLRWVFLFIVLFHGWFSPGPPLIRGAGAWAPSVSGLGYALELVIVVTLMAGLGAVLVRSTAGSDLAAGIAWVLRPLKGFGVPVERFGRRLAWTVDRVEPVFRETSRARDALKLRLAARGRWIARLQREASTARLVLRRAREAADRNAEALYLRGGAVGAPVGPLTPADWGLIGGAFSWALAMALAGGWDVGTWLG